MCTHCSSARPALAAERSTDCGSAGGAEARRRRTAGRRSRCCCWRGRSSLGVPVGKAQRVARLLLAPALGRLAGLALVLVVEQLDRVRLLRTAKPHVACPVEPPAAFAAVVLVLALDIVVNHVLVCRVVSVVLLGLPGVFVIRIAVRVVRDDLRLLCFAARVRVRRTCAGSGSACAGGGEAGSSAGAGAARPGSSSKGSAGSSSVRNYVPTEGSMGPR